MSEHETPARTAPTPLRAAVMVVLVGVLLFALISAIGVAATVLLAGVVGSFTFVVLTVARRRPIENN
ncbi:hypothetical protein [Sporichthya polymorpha]|uniref:hypothetical protein n=1 Tax=Sporichthya polymorpha TaxID=35751 RepID=UPI0012EC0391|nr:hypothetical protein [Sporichthya polymorpha]